MCSEVFKNYLEIFVNIFRKCPRPLKFGTQKHLSLNFILIPTRLPNELAVTTKPTLLISGFKQIFEEGG